MPETFIFWFIAVYFGHFNLFSGPSDGTDSFIYLLVVVLAHEAISYNVILLLTGHIQYETSVEDLIEVLGISDVVGQLVFTHVLQIRILF